MIYDVAAEFVGVAHAADARRTLVYVLDTCLRLLHPYMPFITEELWQRLPHEGESIMVADWPLMEEAGELPRDAAAEAEFASLQALVRGIRNARAEYRVEPAKKVAATVLAAPRLAGAAPAERVPARSRVRLVDELDAYGALELVQVFGRSAARRRAPKHGVGQSWHSWQRADSFPNASNASVRVF